MNNQTDKSVRAECVVTLQPNTLQHIDCMDFMRECPSNYFDLAIVDPPYEIDINTYRADSKHNGLGKKRQWNLDWNVKPNDEYFDELMRVSKNQIIWGVNYYDRYFGEGIIVWDKQNGETNFSDCELAYQSFTKTVRIFRYLWNGMLQGNMKDKEERIHPTQKPVALYRWILKKYGKLGDKILDTHVGSGSSLVACKELGFEYYGCEIDEEYFAKANERIARAYRKYELFE